MVVIKVRKQRDSRANRGNLSEMYIHGQNTKRKWTFSTCGHCDSQCKYFEFMKQYHYYGLQ